MSNQRSFMDSLAIELKIRNQEEWYHVTNKMLLQHGGHGLLVKYNGSIVKLLASVYPEYTWDGKQFHNSAIFRYQGYWDNMENQISFIRDLSIKLNIQDPQDWYKLTAKVLQEHGGYGLLRSKYNGSVTTLLSQLVPEYKNACRELLMRAVRDLHLAKVEELLNVPLEYPSIHHLLTFGYFKALAPKLLHQHDFSISRRTHYTRCTDTLKCWPIAFQS